MNNKYAERSRISAAKIRKAVRYFAADLSAFQAAHQAAQLSRLNRNTVNRIYRGLRERVFQACEARRALFGVVEVDESFSGARRVKDKQGYGLTEQVTWPGQLAEARAVMADAVDPSESPSNRRSLVSRRSCAPSWRAALVTVYRRVTRECFSSSQSLRHTKTL